MPAQMVQRILREMFLCILFGSSLDTIHPFLKPPGGSSPPGGSYLNWEVLAVSYGLTVTVPTIPKSECPSIVQMLSYVSATVGTMNNVVDPPTKSSTAFK